MAVQIQRLLLKTSATVFCRTQWSRIIPAVSLYHVHKAAETRNVVQSRSFLSHPVLFHRLCFSDPTTVCLVGRHSLQRIRSWSSSTNDSDNRKNVSYEELIELIGSKEILVIDVREPYELAQTGLIGDSVNIPLGDLHSAFSLTEKDFKERYKVSKPSTSDDRVVLHCLGGVRSKTGLGILEGLGFEKIRHYPGGWEEWVEKRVSHK